MPLRTIKGRLVLNFLWHATEPPGGFCCPTAKVVCFRRDKIIPIWPFPPLFRGRGWCRQHDDVFASGPKDTTTTKPLDIYIYPILLACLSINKLVVWASLPLGAPSASLNGIWVGYFSLEAGRSYYAERCRQGYKSRSLLCCADTNLVRSLPVKRKLSIPNMVGGATSILRPPMCVRNAKLVVLFIHRH